MDYKLINKQNYEKKQFCKNCQTFICFYNKKQMKKLYPNKNYRIVGEINNKTGIHLGIVEDLNQNPLPLYKDKSHNKLTERIVGYAAVDTNIYVAVIKNVLFNKIIITSISIAVISLIWFFSFRFFI